MDTTKRALTIRSLVQNGSAVRSLGNSDLNAVSCMYETCMYAYGK